MGKSEDPRKTLTEVAGRTLGMLRDAFRERHARLAHRRLVRSGIIEDSVKAPPQSRFSAKTRVGGYTTFSGPPVVRGIGPLSIGRFVAVGDELRVITSNHAMDGLNLSFELNRQLGIPSESDQMGGVTIGSGCWIGDRTTVLPGVTIGNGAVIGAGSVVTSDVPPYAVAVGVPARVTRVRFTSAVVDVLEASHVWDQPDGTLRLAVELLRHGDEDLDAEELEVLLSGPPLDVVPPSAEDDA